MGKRIKELERKIRDKEKELSRLSYLGDERTDRLKKEKERIKEYRRFLEIPELLGEKFHVTTKDVDAILKAIEVSEKSEAKYMKDVQDLEGIIEACKRESEIRVEVGRLVPFLGVYYQNVNFPALYVKEVYVDENDDLVFAHDCGEIFFFDFDVSENIFARKNAMRKAVQEGSFGPFEGMYAKPITREGFPLGTCPKCRKEVLGMREGQIPGGLCFRSEKKAEFVKSLLGEG